MASRSCLRVVGVEVEHSMDREHNLALAAAAIRKSGKADIFLLPELSLCGYPVSTPSLEALASDAHGFFQGLAAEVDAAICYGFVRRLESGYALSQAVVTEAGVLAVYDKINLSGIERAAGFVAGTRPVVFKWRGSRIGLAICYDLRLTELWRDLRSLSVDVVLHACCFERDETFESWRPFVETRAIENQYYIMNVNYAGARFGGSLKMDPWMGYLITKDNGSSLYGLGSHTLGPDDDSLLSMAVDTRFLDLLRTRYPYSDDAQRYLRARTTADTFRQEEGEQLASS